MMCSSADESTESDIDSSDASNGARQDGGRTDREIREEYLDRLRAWTATVRGYQMYYHRLQQDLMLENYRRTYAPPNGFLPVKKKKVPGNVKAPERFVGVRFRIPSLWKRFGAEFFDFLLFIVMKLLFENYIIVPLMDLDLSGFIKYKFQDLLSVDFNTTTDLTSELIIVEVIHRAVVCVNEIYWLQGGSVFQSGATLGKVLYGIQVIQADKLYHIRNQPPYVFATTSSVHLGWKRAALRSVAKNVFFPFLFLLPFSPGNAYQNRCAWDVMCGSIVVEGLRTLKCDQSQLIPVA